MDLKGLDLLHLTKITSHQVDHVTCLECCKYYIAPETAACGHTLCHSCWRGRRTCPSCAAPLERRALKLNLQLQNLTEHVHTLGEAFEKLFNVKLDEFVLDEPCNEVRVSDPTKNVKDWLASSQNQFSAPIINSESFSQDVCNPIELSTSKIQVHTNSKKSQSPQKVIYVPPPQDDWDKIEQLPDTDEINTNNNNKENITNQTNKQTHFFGEEYSMDNPRRSSRKRDHISLNESIANQEVITEKPSSKNSSTETDKKSNKAKQNWSNVKRMRKEFSKLNKKNRSKLNVSIEMCKKTQNSNNKPNTDTEKHKTVEKDLQDYTEQPYIIEDNTPVIDNENDIVQTKTLQNDPTDMQLVTTIEDDIPSINVDNLATAPNQSAVDDKRATNIKSVDNIPKKNFENVNSANDVVIQQKATGVFKDSTLFEKSVSENIPSDNNKSTDTRIPFIKKVELCPNCSVKNQGINNNSNCKSTGTNLDDIEITFKVGNTLTNITIKRKNNDVQLRVKADREVQTSLGCNNLENKNDEYTGVIKNNNAQEIEININKNNDITATKIETKGNRIDNTQFRNLDKTISTKKNTASADTASAQFQITESVEKELSNIMECADSGNNENQEKVNKFINVQPESNAINQTNDENVDEYMNDLDIFDNESVQEQQVQFLNKSKHAPSEILMPTIKTRSLKHPDKRDRDRSDDDDEVPNAKKTKIITPTFEVPSVNNDSMLQQSHKDNESINYDVVMGQVFASIDADIEKSQKSTSKVKTAKNDNSTVITKTQQSQNISQNQKQMQIISLSTQNVAKTDVKGNGNEKYSENVFSILTKDDEIDDLKKNNDGGGSTQRHIENLLTPGMCQDLISTHENEDNMELMNKEQCTPFQENYDSDKSVVEETPQKNISFPKPKTVSDASNVPASLQKVNTSASRAASSSQNIKSIINVSDTLADSTKTSRDQTVLETFAKKPALETPLTINKFVDHIKHKSTPVARKSLNFDGGNINVDDDDVDPEQTLCPSGIVAKTTQEKEIMTKAFEQTPKSPVKKPLTTRNAKVDLKYCIAGSCLSAAELTNVKILCRKYNWKYVDKYTRELTHLVVGVDEENRSQRSVKYMCALAASKWIVSYEWVDACIKTNLVVGESLYEALDGTGEPGPKRSRLAKNKLFEGITFFCMPPFSVLDEDALKEMLEAAGGRVVAEARAARAGAAPALLLAEPEHTQEDRFMYLALELGIVPVNYEWVLNCLGAYALTSVHELLMCPAALLPPATKAWPQVLMAHDSE